MESVNRKDGDNYNKTFPRKFLELLNQAILRVAMSTPVSHLRWQKCK